MIWKRKKRERPDPNVIMPPEGVPLHLRIAGVGVRMGAQITDVAITGIAALCIILLAAMVDLTNPNTLMAIASLLFFIIRIPYYVLSELAWNGQTLGKRMMKIKVVGHDGGPLTTHALVLRNLMKEAEIFLPGTLVFALGEEASVSTMLAFGWVMICLVIPLTNRHRQRLGDMMAGTHVIHLPVPILLPDLAQSQPPAARKEQGYQFLSHQLDHYGAFELKTLEEVLRAQLATGNLAARTRHAQTLATIVEKVRTKTGYADAVPANEHQAFLRAFYNAQRAYLEQRQLFGDRRADKFHASPDDNS